MNVDIEGGVQEELFPDMLESSQHKWCFIRKVYSIIAVQLLATIIVGATVVFYLPFGDYFTSNDIGFASYIILVITPLIVLCPLCYYHQQYPVNYVLLGIFTLSLGFAVGLTCLFTSGKVTLVSMILTTLVVISLILCTFWAAKRGHDFNFLGPFLFGALFVLIIFSLIPLFNPLGIVGVMMFGSVASIIFCGCIVYLTDNLIKRFILSDE